MLINLTGSAGLSPASRVESQHTAGETSALPVRTPHYEGLRVRFEVDVLAGAFGL